MRHTPNTATRERHPVLQFLPHDATAASDKEEDNLLATARATTDPNWISAWNSATTPVEPLKEPSRAFPLPHPRHASVCSSVLSSPPLPSSPVGPKPSRNSWILALDDEQAAETTRPDVSSKVNSPPVKCTKVDGERDGDSPHMLPPAALLQMLSQSESLRPTTSQKSVERSHRRRQNGHEALFAQKERVVYYLEAFLATHRGQLLSLATIGMTFLFIGSFLLSMAPEVEAEPYGERIWRSWTYLVWPGTHIDLTELRARLIGMYLTLVGILYFSVIVGFIVDGIRNKMDRLKRGKGHVAVENHILMLGWTDKSISLIRQICLANQSVNGGIVVVLAEKEKHELEHELQSHLPEEQLRDTHVVFRTGTPLFAVDLLKVAADQAKSIIIMANSGGDPNRSDANVLRTLLSLKTLHEMAGHIVAELRDIDNAPLLKLIGGDRVDVLVSHDVIGRLILTAARSPGLAEVFASVLGFEGNEFYIKEWPECVGVRFDQLVERFPHAVPIGIKTTEGEVMIQPPNDTVVRAGDAVIVLAEDDDAYTACPAVKIDTGSLPRPSRPAVKKERILMCGWRREIRDMIQLLDEFVDQGTELHILCEQPIKIRNQLLQESGRRVDKLYNLKLVHHFGNSAIRRHLETLPLHTFTIMMILADQSREADRMHSDSHSLASLLLLRDLQNSMKINHQATGIEYAGNASLQCKCISEILDPHTQQTVSTSASLRSCSEFIQSNELVSCMLAMISESREVGIILEELLGPDGSTFCVEPCSHYCTTTERVSFWQLAKRVLSQDKILCGYQIHGLEVETVLNPPNKNESREWSNVELICLRDAHVGHSKVVGNDRGPSALASDFELMSRSFRSKQSRMVSKSIVETLLHEKNSIEAEELDVDPLQEALSAYRRASIARTSRRVNSIKELIAATRELLETLKDTDDSNDESDVEEFDSDDQLPVGAHDC